MKKRVMVVLLSAIAFVVFGFQPAEAARVMTLKIGKGQAFVSVLTGSVYVIPSGKREWRSLRVREYLRGGDEVATGYKARIELVLPDNSKVRFADNSRFKILQMDVGKESRDVRFNVKVGRTWANVAKMFGGRSKFEVSSDNAVAGVRGTIYRMNVNEDKSALVRVYDGEVAVWSGGPAPDQPMGDSVSPLKEPKRVAGPTPVEGPKPISRDQWVHLIRSMQQITIPTTGKPGEPTSFTEQEDKDEWVDWNKARDAEQF